MSDAHERAAASPARTVPKAQRQPHGLQGGSEEANRTAVVILEVLAGGRTPADAAVALGMTAPRYYQLETRALQGLVNALEPRPKGKQPSLDVRIAQLEKALQEARRECLRQQALVRASQRSLRIKAPVVLDGKSPGKDAAGRRKRRPTVRALRAAHALRKQGTGPRSPESVQQRAETSRPEPSATDGNGAALGGPPPPQKESQDGTCRT